MCFSFFRAQGIADRRLAGRGGGRRARRGGARAGRGDPTASSSCRSTWCSASASTPTPRPRESTASRCPTAGWASTSARARRPTTPRRSRRAGTVLLERADGRLRARAVRRRHPGGRRGRRRGAGHDGGRRRRLGRRAAAVRARRPGRLALDRRRRLAGAARGQAAAGSGGADGRRLRHRAERARCVAANWKMHKTVAEAEAFLDAFLPRIAGDAAAEVVDLPAVHRAGDGRRARAAAPRSRSPPRTCTRSTAGAFTGEVSAPMLLELGVDGVILGHSERRQLFGETDEALARKVPGGARGRAGADPLRRARPRRSATPTRRRRCSSARSRPTSPRSTDDRLADVVIAYEPIWAIGTGRTATPEQAQEAIAFIRDAARATATPRRPTRSGSSTAARSSRATPPSCSASPTSTARWWAAPASTRATSRRSSRAAG